MAEFTETNNLLKELAEAAPSNQSGMKYLIPPTEVDETDCPRCGAVTNSIRAAVVRGPEFYRAAWHTMCQACGKRWSMSNRAARAQHARRLRERS